MSGRNLARRGGGSYNPNNDNTSQKRFPYITKDSMDEDYEDFVADAPADGGLVGSTSTAIPQQIIPAAPPKKILKLLPQNNSAAPTAPGQDASSGTNASIHAPRNKENNFIP
ncbi:hypothetical protein GLOIN_2v1766278 [Rhizophagus irregularis DAOM 181602=DAOM 197198]|nr:hypothetical protein GLOIN_2v1766278 [Rhizophagus irregularis DAOM 181602=DAOM 197198]